MRRITPERLWRDVQEVAAPDLRRDTAQKAREHAQRQLAELRRDVEKRNATLAALENHPGNQRGVGPKARGLRMFALVLIALDVPVQLLLFRAALPEVELWVSALAAGAFATLLAATVHFATYGFLYDVNRPARSLRRSRTLAALGLGAVALGATVLLFARQASPELASLIVTLTSVSLWTVGEAMPLAAGFVSAWAHMLGHPRRERAELERLQKKVDDWERLLKRLGQELPDEPRQVQEQHELFATDRRTAGLKSMGLVLPFVVALIAGPNEIAAQEPSPACAVFLDRTMSVDEDHREKAIGLLTDGLPDLVEAFNCRELVVGHFADEGPFAPRRWLAVPERLAERDCAAITASGQPGTANVLSLLAGFRKHYRRKARAACEKEREGALATYRKSHADFLRAARSVLAVPQLTEETHTEIWSLAAHLLEAGADPVILVTDGLETGRDSLAALSAKGHLRLVLVPAAERYGAAAATREAARAWNLAGAQTLPYTALVAPTAWARLASPDTANRNMRREP